MVTVRGRNGLVIVVPDDDAAKQARQSRIAVVVLFVGSLVGLLVIAVVLIGAAREGLL